MGTAPSAAGLGQQMALGQGANQMHAGMGGGNLLAMRGALGGGYGQMGQAVDQASQARGQEQAQGLSLYGQGANALGQSDVSQMGLALQNRYRNQQLGMTQSNQNYTFGKGLEDLNNQNNNAQQQLDLQQDANSKMQQARRDAQAQQNAQLGIGIGTAALGATLAFL